MLPVEYDSCALDIEELSAVLADFSSVQINETCGVAHNMTMELMVI